MPPNSSHLDPRTLATITSLELRSRMIVEGIMTGSHSSPYQGISIEFAQHRQYTPGDDLKHLDWKVYGRTDKLYIKQYQKETTLDLAVMVDVSGSMAYSSHDMNGWRKFDHAAALALAMSHLAVRQQDRAGLSLFAGQVLKGTRFSNTTEHWRSLVDMLQSNAPKTADNPEDARKERPAEMPAVDIAATTDLVRVVDQTIARLNQRSLLVLISDLFDSSASLEAFCARCYHRGHDLIVMQVLDPAERTFPFRSASEFIGLEAEGRLILDPAALRKEYLKALESHLDFCAKATRRFGFDYLLVDSSDNLGPVLGQYLARRTALLARGAGR
jgi:uncharacterized protein (DUF58 family)